MDHRPPLPAWPRRDADHLLVSGAQMACLEQALFASGLPVEALMEKAALAVSRRLLELRAYRPGEARPCEAPLAPWPPGGGALVLVGPGHNGGDGLVVARELHLAGVPVRIWCPFERRKPLTESHLRHALWLGIPLLEAAPDPAESCLWVDALFGIGQSRPPGELAESLLLRRQQQHPGALVAIDVPTGLCADSGRRLGSGAATAAITFCIGLLKQGLVQDPALAYVGRLERIDLALPAALLDTLPPEQPLGLGSAGGRTGDQATAPWPAADPAAAKYGRGRLLVVAGSRRYRGAAQLSLAGASASGCGSLRASLPGEVAAALWQLQPHVVIEAALGATAAGGVALGDLPEHWLDRLDAVLLGPGIGLGASPADSLAADSGGSEAERRPWEQLRRFGGLLVLDADGLNRLALGMAGAPLPPAAWLRQRVGPTWITPHAGEFARLFPDLADLPPLEACLQAARLSGAAVLLKGARSIVAAADGRRWQLLAACGQAARAGLGDVLAGYAAGRGAAALAATGPAGWGGDPSLLAAAVLDHACAGGRALLLRGAGGVTPMAVAEALALSPGRLERGEQ